MLDNDLVKVVVIKGEGPVFCSGADLEYLAKIREFSMEENLADSNNLRELFELIYHADKLIISEVNGPALAGGCGLATICDFCFASDLASFGYTEARIGFVPALVMVYLQQKINGKNLRELLLTAEIIPAKKAAEIGLINRVVPASELSEYVFDFANDWNNSISSSSVTYIKKMLRNISGMNHNEALDYAAATNAEARMSDDCIRGIDAFLNKTKIKW